jgi:hypothetical protein
VTLLTGLQKEASKDVDDGSCGEEFDDTPEDEVDDVEDDDVHD